MNDGLQKEVNTTKRKILFSVFVLAFIVAYFVISTLFISKSLFVQSALRHMDDTERSAFQNHTGQLEVRLMKQKSERITSATRWQKFNLVLTRLNGEHTVEVIVPNLNPQYGNANKTMYFNPNTFAFIGYGYRQ